MAGRNFIENDPYDDESTTKKDAMDTKVYHRSFVSAVLDIGASNASPLQILENMAIAKDPKNPLFWDLTLERIKSHLQRFRKSYSNSNNNNNNKKDDSEKQVFLDDYDTFLEFGLEAASAKDEDIHGSRQSGIFGGRIIGLVSRLVMMSDEYDACDEDGVNNNSGEDRMEASNSSSLVESELLAAAVPRKLDTTIPKLSRSEEKSGLGRSILLTLWLLKYMNQFIHEDRQRKEIQGRQQAHASQISRLGYASNDTTAAAAAENPINVRGLDTGLTVPQASQQDSLSMLQPVGVGSIVSLMHPFQPFAPAGYEMMQQEQQPLIHPNILRQGQIHPQQQQQRQESVLDYTHSGINYGELQDINSIQRPLRKPSIDYFHHGQQQQQQRQQQQQQRQKERSSSIDSIDILRSYSIGSSESLGNPFPSEAVEQKVEVANNHAPEVPSMTMATKFLAAAVAMAMNNNISASIVPRAQGDLSNPPQELAIETQKVAVAVATAAAPLSSRKRKQMGRRHPTKQILLRKLQKTISVIGISSKDATPAAADVTRMRVKSSTWWYDRSQIDNDCASVVSSLSSSSSDTEESGIDRDNDHNDRSHSILKTSVTEQQQQQHQQSDFVSVTNTASVLRTTGDNSNSKTKNDNNNGCDGYCDCEEEPWIFDRFSIPRNIRLYSRHQCQQSTTTQETYATKATPVSTTDLGDSDGNKNKNNDNTCTLAGRAEAAPGKKQDRGDCNSCCSCCCSSSTDCGWSIRDENARKHSRSGKME